MAYATSKFDVGKVTSPLHLPLRLEAVFKNNEQVKFHFIYRMKTIDFLEEYEILSLVNKEEQQPKGNTIINPVIILA